MMDLSVEANALGLPVRFPLDESSSVENHPVKSVEDLEPFRKINILRDARIQSYIKTVEMMSMGLPKKILKGAYIIGPATLAGLMESAQQVAMDSVLNPEKLHEVCSFASEVIEEYAMALANAGADLICVLEPTGSILGPQQFREFSSKYVSQILDSYKHTSANTIYHVCGNTMHLIDGMVESGVAALSLDSPETGVDLAKAAEKVPEDIVIMGNVNPTAVMKNSQPEKVREVTTRLLEQMRNHPNFLLSTACDLPPGTPIDNMLEFMKTAREFK
jgi:uroporphyrinogen decarboxylase